MLILYLEPSGAIQTYCYQRVGRYQLAWMPGDQQWIIPGTVDPLDD